MKLSSEDRNAIASVLDAVDLKLLEQGARLILLYDQGWPDAKVVCSGSDPDLGYWCNRQPGHAGDCFSPAKNNEFTPAFGGPDYHSEEDER